MKTIEGLKDEEIIQGLLQIGKHAHIAAHFPGRIRLKISMEGVKALNNGNGNNYENIRIPGIFNFRVNAFARSIIIEYDPGKIPFDLWERLGRVRGNSAQAQHLVTELRTVLSE